MTHQRPNPDLLAEQPQSLMSLLSAARQAVPAVDYALGVAGIAAAGSIVIGLLGNGRAAVIIVGAMLTAMISLFVFARLTTTKSAATAIAGIVLMWSV
jgi:hypothetical protein